MSLNDNPSYDEYQKRSVQQAYDVMRARFGNEFLDEHNTTDSLVGHRAGNSCGPNEPITSARVEFKHRHDVAVPIDEFDLRAEFREAFAAFIGAFDTPMSRRHDNSEYAEDARRRLRNFANKFLGE